MSLKKIIDLDLLGRFLDKVKDLIPTKVSELENDARYMSGMTILSYGKSTWADFMEAYGDNKVVYCRASSGSNPASGSQTRLAFMAYVNNAETPTEVEFQYYRSVNAHTDAQQGDQVYVYKLNKNNGWSVTVRNAFSKLVTGTGLTHTYSNGTITIANSEIVPGVVSTAADGLAPQLPDESTTTKFLRQDATWAVPEYPVTSVNGSIGAVTVDVPSKTSDLQNDSGFITGITSTDVTTALGYTPPRQDTTYESKTAASGGTDVSLVTTGEKYTWNNKGTYSKPSGGIPDSDIASAAVWNAKGNGTITGIKMNGASKGTSGVVDLGTVITAHQDISGKADKSATVSNIAYDSTNKKLTKTINGTTSDVVAATTLKTAMALNNVENKSSATIRGELTKANVTTALGYTPPTTDTTYESKSAASGGTDISLVTTGEKYIWNTKELPSGGSAGQVLKKSSATDYAVEWDDAGGALMIVTVSYNNGYHVDKTFAEIKSAIEDGITVIAHYPQTSNQSGTWGTWFMLKSYDSSNIRFNNISVSYYNTAESIIRVYITSGSSDTYCSYTSSTMVTPSVPSYTRGTPYIKVTYDSENDTYQVEGDGHDISEIIEADINGHGTAILRYQKRDLFNENYDTSDGDYEEYRLMRAYTTHTGGSDSGEEDPEWPVFTGYLIFSCACIENGIIKLKTFSISEQLYNWDNYENATVSYSEASLGAPPAATGVSF